MTALTADRNTKMGYEYLEVEVQLAASQDIYYGGMVCRNSAGKAVPAADTATLVMAGVSMGDKRNGTSTVTSGASDTLYVSLRRRGCFKFAIAAVAITDIGKKCYVADDQTVQLAPSNVEAGFIVGLESATEAWVEINAAQFMGDEDAEDKSIEFVGVAAGKAIVADEGVCLDADGYAVAMDDVTAVSYWGHSMEAADNGAGADGDIDVALQRAGEITYIASSLAAADLGKEVWQATDGETVTKTPGTKLVGVISEVISALSCKVKIVPMAIVGQRTDRQFDIHFSYVGATLNTTKAFENREFARRYICLEGYCDLSAAPGGAVTLSCDLNDGTTTFSVPVVTSATHGENKTAQVPTTATMKAATDTDMTFADAGATSEDPKGVIHCEAL